MAKSAYSLSSDLLSNAKIEKRLSSATKEDINAWMHNVSELKKCMDEINAEIAAGIIY